MKNRFYAAVVMLLACMAGSMAQDLGNGTFRNPILYADYSDPDVIRVGDDYYMTSSSFNCSPGLQVMHSRDLVNWQIISAALPHAIPGGKGGLSVEHGNQVWAPSMRHHNGLFYIMWGDPDCGIFQVHAPRAEGPWSEPTLVIPAKGFIDATPLWDEDGKTYIVHAMAGSRAGLKSVICMAEVDAELTHVLVPSQIIFDGHQNHPTCEGPKIYKKDGYYYILLPAGGVATGWQLCLRSTDIYGPYEEKIVMKQGDTMVNGPHQGGWVTTPKGEDWFIHFQDVGPLGRIIHLQPMTWKKGWPVIGEDKDGDGCGEPVFISRKPDSPVAEKTASPKRNHAIEESPYNTLNGTDLFNTTRLDLKWQWHGEPQARWYFADAATSRLRLYSVEECRPDGTMGDASNLWNMPNLLLQKPYAPTQQVTAKLMLRPTDKYVGERGGLVMMGMDYAALVLENTEDGLVIKQVENKKANKGGVEKTHAEVTLPKRYAEGEAIYFRLNFETQPMDVEKVKATGNADRVVYAWFSYSYNGRTFTAIGERFTVATGQWIGAKYGMFCSRPGVKTNDGGWLDVYDVKVE